MSSMTEATTSSNEDLLFGKSETQTKNENNISPPKKSDCSSGIPRPPREKSARKRLVLDIPCGNNKAKSAVPGLLSPTLSPDLTKRRTQSRYDAEYHCFSFFQHTRRPLPFQAITRTIPK